MTITTIHYKGYLITQKDNGKYNWRFGVFHTLVEALVAIDNHTKNKNMPQKTVEIRKNLFDKVNKDFVDSINKVRKMSDEELLKTIEHPKSIMNNKQEFKWTDDLVSEFCDQLPKNTWAGSVEINQFKASK